MSNNVLEAVIGAATHAFMRGLICRSLRPPTTGEVVVDLNGDAIGYYIVGEFVTNKQMAEAIYYVKHNDK